MITNKITICGLSLLVVFLLTRFVGLGSGLNILEPDEWDYQQISQSFAQGWIPTWNGYPYLEKFPLYVSLGYLLELLIPLNQAVGPYVNLRLISIVSSGVVIGWVFWILKKETSLALAFLSSLLLIITPVWLFYSRVGTLEGFTSMFALVIVGRLLYAQNKPSRMFYLTLGILLVLAVLAKQINLVLLLLPLSVGVYSWVIKKRWEWAWFLSLGGCVVLLASIFWGLGYIQQEVARPLIELGERFISLSPTKMLGQLLVYLQQSGYWLSLPLSVWLSLGIIIWVYRSVVAHTSFKGRQLPSALIVWILGTVLIGWIILILVYSRVTPRNLFYGVPFLFIAATLGYHALGKRYTTWVLVGTIMVGILAVPAAWSAGKSGLHQGLEISMAKFGQYHDDYPDLALYTSIDPEKVSALVGYPVSLVSSEATEFALVIIEVRKTELFANLTEPEFVDLKKTVAWLHAHKTPIWTYVDPFPHFPGTDKPNEFRIYLLD